MQEVTSLEKTIELCGQRVCYQLQRKNVKNVNLRIRADGSVAVSANNRVPLYVIESFIISKGEYILSAMERAAERRRMEPEINNYETGQRLWLFGRPLELELVQGLANKVALCGDRLVVTVKDRQDEALRKRTIETWLLSQCREKLEDICRKIYPMFREYNIAYPQIKFRRMRSCWGSCMPGKGTITFNTYLAGAPESCMEYVAVHEFNHFLHANHSPDFYRSLEKFMPDWRERKKLLSNWQGLLQ